MTPPKPKDNDMNLKDNIEETITFYLAERDFYGVCWVEDATDAIIAALPEITATQWQPIDTAPRDGTYCKFQTVTPHGCV